MVVVGVYDSGRWDNNTNVHNQAKAIGHHMHLLCHHVRSIFDLFGKFHSDVVVQVGCEAFLAGLACEVETLHTG